ncbi:MAG: ATP-binding protein [Armatimonadota bacterium]
MLIAGDNVDINSVLGILGTAVRADRVCVFQLRDGAKTADNTYEWYTPGIVSEVHNIQGCPVEDAPWWVDQIFSDKVIAVQDTAQMPPEATIEQEVLMKHNVKALLVVPMRSQGKLIGCLGFDDTTSPRTWSKYDEYLLRTAADCLAAYFERSKMIEAMYCTRDELRMQVSAINAASDQIIITDYFCKIKFVNPAFTKDNGYTFEEAIDQSVSILRHEGHDRDFYKKIWDTVHNGDTWQGEIPRRRKDGTTYISDATVTPVEKESGCIEYVVVIQRDITERKLYEERLQQTRKMETVGMLAAGIAHDFNNLLQAILGYTHVILDTSQLDMKTRSDLVEVERASQRAADLVQQIRAFSQQVPKRMEPVDVLVLVQEVAGLLCKTLPRTIKTVCEASAECLPVLADSSQIHQVLMNLCLNAEAAMPDGGRLMVNVDPVSLTEEFVKSNPWARTGMFTRFTVSDTGCGMNEKTIRAAFEPFFTTKSTGSGLGLSVCYGIIRTHNGLINIESKLGKGTSVSVYLPVTTMPEASSPAAGVVSDVTGNETVLLVEDEDYIQRLTKRVLEHNGYKVLTAGNGQDALDCLGSPRGKDVEIVLLDLNMPGMNGLRAISAIRQILPSMKVLITAGIDTGIDTLPENERPNDFLQKPYKPEVLLETVRRLLNDKNGHTMLK